MCGSTKAPPVVKDDPVADAKKAEAKATSKSNADLAERRRRRARNSLLTLGSQGTDTRVDTADNLLASIDRGLVAAPKKVTTGGGGTNKKSSKLDLDPRHSLNLGDQIDNSKKVLHSLGGLFGL
ncbi:MAG TPA: hypothetical protein VFK31_09625 [Rhodanobacteraceae bacterium]|nr:hypothetical protein [Rhodanobacteraceae bacterium]